MIETKITKDDLIKKISRDTTLSQTIVRTVYESIEKEIYDGLSMVNDKQNITIRLFDGFVINGTYVPEKEKVSNLTGETITTVKKIKPTATFSRRYKEHLSSILSKIK